MNLPRFDDTYTRPARFFILLTLPKYAPKMPMWWHACLLTSDYIRSAYKTCICEPVQIRSRRRSRLRSRGLVEVRVHLAPNKVQHRAPNVIC